MGASTTGCAVVLVEVETDDGLLGVGESVAAFPADAVVHEITGVTPLFLGEPAWDVERLVTRARYLGSFNHTPWHANFVLAGVEMALWDLLGKAAGTAGVPAPRRRRARRGGLLRLRAG